MEEKTLVETLTEHCPGAVLEASAPFGDLVLVIRPEALLEIVQFLKDGPARFDMLLDLTCVDYPDRPDRFELVYHLLSLPSRARIRIKCALPDGAAAATLTGLWKNADWLEREVFDMFGVRFEGHPDLRRILMYENFEGHPLRKDYPFRKRQPRLAPRT